MTRKAPQERPLIRRGGRRATHPSPRNQMCFKRNPRFADELIPFLRCAIRQVLDGGYVLSPEAQWRARITSLEQSRFQ